MTTFQRGRWIAAVERRRRASAGLMWLARHRDRLYTLTLGSAHFFVVFGFDRDGAKRNSPISDAEVDAMRLVAWGESPVVERTRRAMPGLQIVPWEDNWGEVNWMLMRDGRAVSSHANWDSANAARESILLEQPEVSDA